MRTLIKVPEKRAKCKREDVSGQGSVFVHRQQAKMNKKINTTL